MLQSVFMHNCQKADRHHTKLSLKIGFKVGYLDSIRVYFDIYSRSVVVRIHPNELGLWLPVASTRVQGWGTNHRMGWGMGRGTPLPTLAWGWANGGQPILVCYIRKCVIILGGIFPLTSPQPKYWGDVSPASPAGLTPVMTATRSRSIRLRRAVRIATCVCFEWRAAKPQQSLYRLRCTVVGLHAVINDCHLGPKSRRLYYKRRSLRRWRTA